TAAAALERDESARQSARETDQETRRRRADGGLAGRQSDRGGEGADPHGPRQRRAGEAPQERQDAVHRRAGGELHLPGARSLRPESRRHRDRQPRPRHPSRGGADGEIPRGPDQTAGDRHGTRRGPREPAPLVVVEIENEKTQSRETEKSCGQTNGAEKSRQKIDGQKSESESEKLG